MSERACVSALIVTYESRSHIGACLESIERTAASLLAGCHIVDNCSSDGTADMLEAEFPQVDLIRNAENIGFGRAVNQAAARASGDYLLIVNPDTIIRPGTIESLVRFMDYRPGAGACGPKIVDFDGEFQYYCRRGFPTPLNSLAYLTGLDRLFPSSRRLSGYYRRDIPGDIEMITDSLAGCFMLVRREAFAHVGGFDEDYFLFGEDIDLCWKLKEAGFEVWYVPSAVAVHRKGASMSRARDVARREFYRAMKLFMDKRLTPHYSRITLAFAKMGVNLVSLLERRFR
jgi:GT2 family glycosyltransferase